MASSIFNVHNLEKHGGLSDGSTDFEVKVTGVYGGGGFHKEAGGRDCTCRASGGKTNCHASNSVCPEEPGQGSGTEISNRHIMKGRLWCNVNESDDVWCMIISM